MAKVTPRKTSAKSTAAIQARSSAFSSLTGRISGTGIPTTIPGYRTRTFDLLSDLRRERDAYRAIELITDQHPDASQAVQSYVRLANNGHTMEIRLPNSEERNKDAESRWKEFSQRVGGVNTEGFDGLIDQMHSTLIRFGGFGVECTVNRRMRDVEEVHPILPQWITWEYESDGKWHAYQQQGMKKVELSSNNFFWTAIDSEVGKPIGKLLFEPSLISIERQLQFFEDSAAVLRRAGYPRNDISIDREAVMLGMPPSVKSGGVKAQREYLSDYFDQIVALLRRLDPKDDIVHFDDINVNKTQGENSRTIDQRAYLETIDPQVMNGLATMGVMLNRTTGVTETWGTVQFKIMTQTIQSIHRCSKRMSEQICRFWLQVNGIQGSCTFTHNPVDWEAEAQRAGVALSKQELHRRAEEYGWEDKPMAAKESMGIFELPTKSPESRTAYITHSIPPDGDGDNQGTEE